MATKHYRCVLSHVQEPCLYRLVRIFILGVSWRYQLCSYLSPSINLFVVTAVYNSKD